MQHWRRPGMAAQGRKRRRARADQVLGLAAPPQVGFEPTLLDAAINTNGSEAQIADTAKLQSLGADRDVQALTAKLDQLAKPGDDDVIKQVTSGMSDHMDVSLGPVLPNPH